MTDFVQLVNARRSANNFLSDKPITKEAMSKIFQFIKLSPSAFNLQHTKYVTVLDHVIKEKLKKAANGKYKVCSSSAVILVLGNGHAYQQAAEIFEGLMML